MKQNKIAVNLANGSMLLYMIWLLLPAVQAGLHAVTGALTIGIFALGILLDGETLKNRAFDYITRAILAVALPLCLFYFLNRGAGNLPGYLAQQGMFWFPLLWCAYARQKGDPFLYRYVKPLLIALIVITTVTTTGWLIQGMLRGGKVYAYARSLGNAEPGREAYLRELMLRNIGGYDFIYASVLLLPITFYLILSLRGGKKAAAIALYLLQLAMIGLSQYTYAIVFAAGITGVEVLSLLLRTFFHRLPIGASMMCTVPIFVLLWVFRMPLVNWATGLATALGFENAAYSLSLLSTLFSGGSLESGSRMQAYAVAWHGFLASPWFGSIFTGIKKLGMHSDFLDLLSGMGLFGTVGFGLGAWQIGRGAFRGIGREAPVSHIVLQWIAFLACLALGTVFYSREISLVMCLVMALLQREEKPQDRKGLGASRA